MEHDVVRLPSIMFGMQVNYCQDKCASCWDLEYGRSEGKTECSCTEFTNTAELQLVTGILVAHLST